MGLTNGKVSFFLLSCSCGVDASIKNFCGAVGGGPRPGLEWACGGLVVGFGGLVVGFGGLSVGFGGLLVGFLWALVSFGGLR